MQEERNRVQSMPTSPSHNGKFIITCAITGSIHTPSMSPYLPVTPNDVVDSALEGAEAGAAILQTHAGATRRATSCISRGLTRCLF